MHNHCNPLHKSGWSLRSCWDPGRVTPKTILFRGNLNLLQCFQLQPKKETSSSSLRYQLEKSFILSLPNRTTKYHRPVNCRKVVVPKVKEEIWSKLPRPARGKELKFSRLQTNMTKVGHRCEIHRFAARIESQS